jgi:hypothetical protein
LTSENKRNQGRSNKEVAAETPEEEEKLGEGDRKNLLDQIQQETALLKCRIFGEMATMLTFQ